MSTQTLQRRSWSKTTRRTQRAWRKTRRLCLEQLEAKELLAANLFVAMTGDDFQGVGSLAKPYQTLERALDAAQPGDTIQLRGGTYGGGITVMKSNLTIQSYPGEWAVLSGPTNDPTYPFGLRFYPDSHDCTLKNLEISGGYYHAVKTEEAYDWGRPTKYGTSHLTIEGCKLHDSGVDVVKLVAGSDDAVLRHNEIYNSGRRTPQSADGIDNLNSDRMLVEDNYIHDIAGNGILTSAGSIGVVIQRNYIADAQLAGINLGYYSEREWMDVDVQHPDIYSNPTNPQLYTSIDNVARNNIVVDAGMAGIALYGS